MSTNLRHELFYHHLLRETGIIFPFIEKQNTTMNTDIEANCCASHLFKHSAVRNNSLHTIMHDQFPENTKTNKLIFVTEKQNQNKLPGVRNRDIFPGQYAQHRSRLTGLCSTDWCRKLSRNPKA